MKPQTYKEQTQNICNTVFARVDGLLWTRVKTDARCRTVFKNVEIKIDVQTSVFGVHPVTGRNDGIY